MAYGDDPPCRRSLPANESLERALLGPRESWKLEGSLQHAPPPPAGYPPQAAFESTIRFSGLRPGVF